MPSDNFLCGVNAPKVFLSVILGKPHAPLKCERPWRFSKFFLVTFTCRLSTDYGRELGRIHPNWWTRRTPRNLRRRCVRRRFQLQLQRQSLLPRRPTGTLTSTSLHSPRLSLGCRHYIAIPAFHAVQRLHRAPARGRLRRLASSCRHCAY